MTATTLEFSDSQHTWWMPGRIEGGSWVFEEGWKVEEDGGRFEVCYHTHERMRFGADGSLSLGRPEGYWFNTREWAQLCAERLNSLDRAFAPGVSINATGNLMIGLNTASQWAKSTFEFRQSGKSIVTLGQGGGITHLDLPALVGIWWRGTTAYRAWRKLMWGERA
jgi:hypothetical protein